MDKEIAGVKGFDKDLRCMGFQFKPNDIYKTDSIKLCEKGFHFCKNPLDVFNYYAPGNSRYAEVVGAGELKEAQDDTKVVCSELHVKAEISLINLIAGGVKFILDRVDWKNDKATNTGYYSAATNTGDYSAATNTGYYSAATNTGDYSAATNTGYRSAATNTGDYSAAEVSGDQSIACGLGIDNKVRGSKGCWLVLSEWKEKDNKWIISKMLSVKVDGKEVKGNTWYELKNGKIKEV